MKNLNEMLTESKSMIQLSDAIDKLNEIGKKSIPVSKEYDNSKYTGESLAADLEIVIDLCGNIDVDDLTNDDAKNYIKTLFK